MRTLWVHSRNVLILASLASLFSFTAARAAAPSCGTLGDVWQEYLSGLRLKAITRLECLTRETPQDLDYGRLLSDMHWWEGDLDSSRNAARTVLSHVIAPSLSDSRVLKLRRRLQDIRISGQIGLLQATSNSGFEAGVEAEFHYFGRNRIRAGVVRLSRAYGAGAPISDTLYRLGHSGPLGSSGYWEGSLELARQPIYSPKTRFQIEPHFALSSDAELFLGFRNSNYATLNVAELQAGGLLVFTEGTKAGLKLSGTFSDGLHLSAAFHVDSGILPRLSARFDAGGGRVREDSLGIDAFRSAGLSFRFLVSDSVTLAAGSSAYWSDRRSELRGDTGFDFHF